MRTKSRSQVRAERAMKTDKKFNDTLKHILIAELYDYEVREKVHDKSLDWAVTYALKAEALLKRAVNGGISKAELDALLEEKPEIEGKIIIDHRIIDPEEVAQYRRSSKNILKGIKNEACV